ncbi:g3413 [Coccomyxa elongata]
MPNHSYLRSITSCRCRSSEDTWRRVTGKAAHSGSPGRDHRTAMGQELFHQSNGLAGGLTLPSHDARDCFKTGIGPG